MRKKMFILLSFCIVLCSCKEESIVPTVSFNTSMDGLCVVFTNTSTHAVSYRWDFGDSNFSSETSPTHNYSKAGSYNVVLRAVSATGEQNQLGQTVTVKSNIITPTADFWYTANGLTVALTNKSSNASSYKWAFGDGETSTTTSPTHTYNKAGTYTITLYATSSTGQAATLSKTLTVKEAAPTAKFTVKTQHPITVVLTNTSSNATSYKWNFGDGSSSTEKSPTHKYSHIGEFAITLTVSNNAGASNSYTQTVKMEAPSKCYFNGITIYSLSVYDKYIYFRWLDGGLLTSESYYSSYELLSKISLPKNMNLKKGKSLISFSETSYLIYLYYANTSTGNGTKFTDFRYYTSDLKTTYPTEITMSTTSGNKITAHFLWE